VKRVLFDEDVPRQLKRDLPEFSVRTVQEEGWSSIKNGELLGRASQSFDVLVTADRRLQHQQNLAQFTIAVVVLATVDTRLPHLQSRVAEIRAAIEGVSPGSLIVVR